MNINNRTTNNVLSQMREQVLKLESAEVEFIAIEKEQNESNKQAFLSQREYYRNHLHQLEKQDLESVLAKMKPLEAELHQAIISLDNALESVNDTVNVISNIQSVTSIVARIITIV